MTDATTAEAFVANAAAKAGRACGNCSMCCLVLDVPEAGKPKLVRVVEILKAQTGA